MNITPNFFLSNEVRFASMKSWAGSRLFHTLAFEQNVVAKLMKKLIKNIMENPSRFKTTNRYLEAIF